MKIEDLLNVPTAEVENWDEKAYRRNTFDLLRWVGERVEYHDQWIAKRKAEESKTEDEEENSPKRILSGNALGTLTLITVILAMLFDYLRG